MEWNFQSIYELYIHHPSQIKTRYSTASIHCDPWAGEPDDMINVVINLIINSKTSTIKIIKTNDKETQIYRN